MLERAQAFQHALDEALGAYSWDYPLDARQRFAGSAATLSLEHGVALLTCFASDLPQSASALLRLQFEALVRSAWLLYSAPDDVVGTIENGLSMETDAVAKKWPMAPVMLQALSTQAPLGLYQPLHQFQAVAWQALNSFVHAGIHPMSRHAQGFPEVLALQQIQSSNGLTHIAYRLLASLTGNAEAMTHLTGLWEGFEDCLPPVAE